MLIGTSILLFEGSITLLLPLHQSIQSKSEQHLFSIVYPWVIRGIIVFYIVFAMVCWMGFGDDVNIVLTTSSVPSSGWLSTSVQFVYSLAVIFSFPL
jgi:solute carrier family 36 (proton-coupled amino acid transporter)